MGSLRYRHLKRPSDTEFVSLVNHGVIRGGLHYQLGPIQDTLQFIASILFPDFNPDDHPVYWRAALVEQDLSSQGLKVTLKGDILSNGSLGILGHPIQLLTTIHDLDTLDLVDRAYKEYVNDSQLHHEP